MLTVFFATLAGIGSIRLVTMKWPDLGDDAMYIAFGAAAAVQALLPIAIERRGDIVAWLMSLLPRRGGGQ